MYETEANQNPLRQELFLLEFKIGVLPFNFKEEKEGI
jgi:hypothetical protein